MVKQLNMPELDLLDIGGGFSDSTTNFPNIENVFSLVAPKVNNYLETVFPGENKNIKVIGEPGRQIAQEAQSLIVNVFLKKDQRDVSHCYINNGVYHGLGSIVFDGEKFKP